MAEMINVVPGALEDVHSVLESGNCQQLSFAAARAPWRQLSNTVCYVYDYANMLCSRVCSSPVGSKPT